MLFLRYCSNSVALINDLFPALLTLFLICFSRAKCIYCSACTGLAMMPLWFWSTVLLLTINAISFLVFNLLPCSLLLCCSTVSPKLSPPAPLPYRQHWGTRNLGARRTHVSLLKNSTRHNSSTFNVCMFLSLIIIYYSPQTA